MPRSVHFRTDAIPASLYIRKRRLKSGSAGAAIVSVPAARKPLRAPAGVLTSICSGKDTTRHDRPNYDRMTGYAPAIRSQISMRFRTLFLKTPS